MKCKHCFYWKNLSADRQNLQSAYRTGRDDKNVLTLEEIEKIASSLKYPLSAIIITGGEPFLHPQIVEICKTFYAVNKPLNFHLMTNGASTDKIIEASKSIVKNVSANLHFQVSLDGLENLHDEIRGTKGCFNSAVKTLKELKQLSNIHPNVTVHILTVVSKLNSQSASGGLRPLAEFAINNLKVPISFEFARGNELFKDNPMLSKHYNPAQIDKTLLGLDEMQEAYKEIKKIYTIQKAKLGADLSFSLIGLKKGIELIELKHKIVTCVAGNQIGTLYPDGEVTGCELIEPRINIRNFELDFYKLWQSEEMDKFRKEVKNCYCIHSCFLQASLLNSIKYGIFYHTHS